MSNDDIRVKVYSTPNCLKCKDVKMKMNADSISYVPFDGGHGSIPPEVMQLATDNSVQSFPLVVVDGTKLAFGHTANDIVTNLEELLREEV